MEDYIVYDNILYHHGIKGQRWGVRRFQKKDGSLTSAGKKRRNNSDSDKTQKNSLSDKQKKVIIAGAVAATAILAGYGAYKIHNSRYFDRCVDAGKTFYRQGHSNESTEGLNDLIYATIRKSDARMYEKASDVGNVSYKIINSDKVKIAGNRTAKKVYNEVLKNNPAFREAYGHMKYEDFNGSLGQANKMLIDYKMPLHDTYMDPFFEKLREKGYSAVVDTQDKFAKIPVILINSYKNYSIKP